MPEHVLISCHQCQRGLRVRVNYLGQSVGCNHCGHLFVAEARDDFSSVSTSTALPNAPRYSRIDPAESPNSSTVPVAELKQLRADRLRLKTENDRLITKLAAANSQRLAHQLRADDLEAQLQRAHDHDRLVQDELAACERDRSEINRLRIEAIALRDKALHTLRLEDELQTLQQQVEQRQTEHEEELARALRERDEAVNQLDRAMNRLALWEQNSSRGLSGPDGVIHSEGIRGSTQPDRPEGEPLIE